MHYEASLVVKAPREKVYSTYIDFEAMPKWSGQARVVKVLGRDGDTVRLEVESASGDSNRKRVSELKLFPPEKVESQGETRFTKTKRTVAFGVVPEGTRVTASLEVQFKGRWSWVLRGRGRAEVESSALKELSSFAAYVEGMTRPELERK